MSLVREAQASMRLDGETRVLTPLVLPALSLTQPWCEMVLDPTIDKNIENRVWNCHKRGTFLIHAAQRMTGAQYRNAVHFACQVTGRAIDTGADARYLPQHTRDDVVLTLPDPREVVRGGIVGAAEILDVVPLDRIQVDSGGFGSTHPQASNPWLMDGCYGFVLGKRVRLPFRAYPGRQRWFNVELTAAEEATLRAAGLVTT